MIQYNEFNNSFIIRKGDDYEFDDSVESDDLDKYASMVEAKKFIDDYYKIDAKFEPYYALRKRYISSDDPHVIQIVSIRQNGTLVYFMDNNKDIPYFLELNQRHLLYNFDANYVTNNSKLDEEFETIKDKYYTDKKQLVTNLIPLDLSHLG